MAFRGKRPKPLIRLASRDSIAFRAKKSRDKQKERRLGALPQVPENVSIITPNTFTNWSKTGNPTLEAIVDGIYMYTQANGEHADINFDTTPDTANYKFSFNYVHKIGTNATIDIYIKRSGAWVGTPITLQAGGYSEHIVALSPTDTAIGIASEFWSGIDYTNFELIKIL